MDLSSRGWSWKTLVRSGLRTDGFDARKNEIYLEWCGDEHLQTRGHVMIHSDRALTGDSQRSEISLFTIRSFFELPLVAVLCHTMRQYLNLPTPAFACKAAGEISNTVKFCWSSAVHSRAVVEVVEF